MFLKQEKPKMDDLKKKKKTFGFNAYPCKNVTSYFAYSFVSEHFFNFYKKHLQLMGDDPNPPPPH